MNIFRPYIAASFVDKCFIVASLLVFVPIISLMSNGDSLLATLFVMPFLLRALYLDNTNQKLFLTRPKVYLCIVILFGNAAVHQFVLKPLLNGI